MTKPKTQAQPVTPSPEPVEPPAILESAVTRSGIRISIKATIPLMQYGNVVLEAAQEIDLAVNDETSRSVETIAGLNRLKEDMALVVLPLVEAEVNRARPALMVEQNPDAWMRRNCAVYQWLRIMQPDLYIEPMQQIMENEQRIALTNNKNSKK